MTFASVLLNILGALSIIVGILIFIFSAPHKGIMNAALYFLLSILITAICFGLAEIIFQLKKLNDKK